MVHSGTELNNSDTSELGELSSDLQPNDTRDDPFGTLTYGVDTLFIIQLLGMLSKEQLPLTLICVGGVTNLVVAMVMVRLVIKLRKRPTGTGSRGERNEAQLDQAGIMLAAAYYYIASILLLCVVEGYDWAQPKFSAIFERQPTLHSWCCKLWQYSYEVLRGLSSWMPLVILWLQCRAEKHAKKANTRHFRVQGYCLAKGLMCAVCVTLLVLNVHSLWLYDTQKYACMISTGHSKFFTRFWPTIIHVIFSTLPSVAMLFFVLLQILLILHGKAQRTVANKQGIRQAQVNNKVMSDLARASKRLAWTMVVHKVLFDFPCETGNAVIQVIPDPDGDNYIVVTAMVVFMRLATMLCYTTAPIMCLLCDHVYRSHLCALACAPFRWRRANKAQVAAASRPVASQETQCVLGSAMADDKLECNAVGRHQLETTAETGDNVRPTELGGRSKRVHIVVQALASCEMRRDQTAKATTNLPGNLSASILSSTPSENSNTQKPM